MLQTAKFLRKNRAAIVSDFDGGVCTDTCVDTRYLEVTLLQKKCEIYTQLLSRFRTAYWQEIEKGE
jgi:hypothetical protein|nr:MAG: hypothetical protein DIU61_15470 [Bacteroidota bacterium]